MDILPTCNRCQRRKIKCDKLLPACKACAKSGVDCVFFDSASQGNVARSYVALLDQKLRDLESDLRNLKAITSFDDEDQEATSQQRQLLDGNTTQDATLRDSHYGSLEQFESLSFIHTTKSSSTVFIGPGTLASVGMAAVQKASSLGINLSPSSDPNADIRKIVSSYVDPDTTKLDRKVISLACVRELVNYYRTTELHRCYPVSEAPEIQIESSLKKMPTSQCFQIVTSSAISAALQMRHNPVMSVKALALRQWSHELIASMWNTIEDINLADVLLLILYELVDPSRRVVWNLVGLACRIVISLGWHRKVTIVAHNENADEDAANLVEQRKAAKLFLVLYEIERRLCHAFGRPTLLADVSIDMSQSSIFELGDKFQNLIKESTLWQLLYNGSAPCPVSTKLINEVQNMDRTLQFQRSWLMLHALFGHSCAQCRTSTRWVEDIEDAAINLIDTTYQEHRLGHTFSVWLSAIDVFRAGVILLDINLQRQLRQDSRHKAVRAISWSRCVALLNAYAETWAPARTLRDFCDKLATVAHESIFLPQ